MTDFDFAPFAQAFGRLMTLFRLKLRPAERDELTRTYFKLLEPHDIADVVDAGARCAKKNRTFPKPVDWLAELAPVPASCPQDRRQMRADEIDALEWATAMRYQDQPCLCAECVRAGIDDQPLRYVPTEIGDDELERAFNPRNGRVEVVGHWAHGDELARWYRARAAFYATWRRAPRTLAYAVAVIVGEREPGSDD
jgi:hypothetical protein